MAREDSTQRRIVVRNISDTARWAAVFRAEETERPDAIFRDPYAKELAGTLGLDIANSLPEGKNHAWAWVARTYLFDQYIEREIQRGADMVVNLAAGLDARPYRMNLPDSFQWVEVDLPEILNYKEEILAQEKPACALERVRLDLTNTTARRELFQQVGKGSSKALIITEGLLAYLTPQKHYVRAGVRAITKPSSLAFFSMLRICCARYFCS